MPTLFFSYSHQDEGLRDQLEVHLAALKRQGVISTWHDRRISAGTEFGNSIDQNLNEADVILLLISPDFINSDYCYEREMMRAMERHDQHEARVIPIILRPCDWHGLPFGKLLAAPKDGKPVTKWADQDDAFLDIVAAIKAALKELGKTGPSAPSRPRGPATTPITSPIRSSNFRIRKQFSDLDRDTFRHEGFDFIAKFFEASLLEVVNRNPGLAQRFQRVDANHFSASLYQNGEKVCRGSASIGGGHMGSDTIQYSMTDTPRDGGMNEALFDLTPSHRRPPSCVPAATASRAEWHTVPHFTLQCKLILGLGNREVAFCGPTIGKPAGVSAIASTSVSRRLHPAWMRSSRMTVFQGTRRISQRLRMRW